jgi:hypothetical protein
MLFAQFDLNDTRKIDCDYGCDVGHAEVIGGDELTVLQM